jgi:hypothetical protein
MYAYSSSPSGRQLRSLATVVGQTTVLLLPAALLLLGSSLATNQTHMMLWLGAVVEILACTLISLRQRGWRQPLGPPVITLYLIALAWIWASAADLGGWYPHLAQAVLLLVPLAVFASQVVMGSGAPALRRARVLAQRLAARKDWPVNLADCRSLPEVKALREAVHTDASPALALLQHPRPQVRAAALAALEFRKDWEPNQLALVQFLAQCAPEPAVRAAAISALGNVDDRQLVENLAEFLRDPALEVRRAATEALLWDTERRWPWVRSAVRRAYADHLLPEDDALWSGATMLPPEAIHDLTAWASERGLLAGRAARTLGAYFGRALADQPNEELLGSLRNQVGNPHAPVALRMELARLLQEHRGFDEALLDRLLSPANPAPLRLMAAEALLADGQHPEAVAALRDIARLPNREIALSTAEVIQRRLGVDLGLAVGQPLPPVYSRQAAEVTRRVMAWATAAQEEPVASES